MSLTASRPLALVIEDDSKLGEIFALALRAADYQTEIINNGGVAQTRLQEVVPNIVVLDLQLPEVPGERLFRQIRADPRLTQTWVILATAVGFLADELRHEADLVLVKPISPIQLRDLALRLRTHPG